eukprot:CAMPEP_0167745046 /NCGR_PEP_ID=MMETSP0110_2-20121227/2932_1 /TAXON_ID=629695 /ORGANISM="Gymnochlora sp., Strain CCMP2014" /LENGTH=715 /DNA_ID=CAMNT_0007629641 /DNA_START=1208 /DNA_END=3355 /DNA_ORIENTATION=+
MEPRRDFMKQEKFPEDVGTKYQIVALRGALVREGVDLDSRYIGYVSKGTIVEVLERRNHRVRIASPVVGWISVVVRDTGVEIAVPIDAGTGEYEKVDLPRTTWVNQEEGTVRNKTISKVKQEGKVVKQEGKVVQSKKRKVISSRGMGSTAHVDLTYEDPPIPKRRKEHTVNINARSSLTEGNRVDGSSTISVSKNQDDEVVIRPKTEIVDAQSSSKVATSSRKPSVSSSTQGKVPTTIDLTSIPPPRKRKGRAEGINLTSISPPRKREGRAEGKIFGSKGESSSSLEHEFGSLGWVSLRNYFSSGMLPAIVLPVDTKKMSAGRKRLCIRTIGFPKPISGWVKKFSPWNCPRQNILCSQKGEIIEKAIKTAKEYYLDPISFVQKVLRRQKASGKQPDKKLKALLRYLMKANRGNASAQREARRGTVSESRKPKEGDSKRPRGDNQTKGIQKGGRQKKSIQNEDSKKSIDKKKDLVEKVVQEKNRQDEVRKGTVCQDRARQGNIVQEDSSEAVPSEAAVDQAGTKSQQREKSSSSENSDLAGRSQSAGIVDMKESFEALHVDNYQPYSSMIYQEIKFKLSQFDLDGNKYLARDLAMSDIMGILDPEQTDSIVADLSKTHAMDKNSMDRLKNMLSSMKNEANKKSARLYKEASNIVRKEMKLEPEFTGGRTYEHNNVWNVWRMKETNSFLMKVKMKMGKKLANQPNSHRKELYTSGST